MPKVPYTGLPQENANPLPQNRLSSAGANEYAFGAGVAQGNAALSKGLAHVSSDTQQIAEQMYAQERERQFTDATTAWQTFVRETMVGTPDKPGYYSYKGDDAIKNAPATGKALQEMQQKMAKDIQDPRVRASFQRMSANDVDQHLTKMGEYTIGERERAVMASRTSLLAAQVDNAAAFGTDPVMMQEALDTNRLVIENMQRDAGNHGDTPEGRLITEQAIKQQNDKTLSAAILNVNREDSTAASKMLDQYQGEMTGETFTKLREIVKDGALTEFSQSFVDHILSLPELRTDGKLDEKKALAYARNQLHGEQEDEVVKRLNAQMDEVYKQDSRDYYESQRILARANAEIAAAAKEDDRKYRAVEREIYSFINAGSGNYDDWARQNPEGAIVAGWKDTGKFDRAYATKLRGDNGALVSEPGLLPELTAMPFGQLAEVDPTDYQLRLTPADQDKLAVRVAAAKNRKTEKQNSSYTAADKSLGRYAPTALNWGKATDDDGLMTQRNNYRDRMYEWINNEIHQGRVPEPKAIDEKAREIALSFHVTSDSYKLFDEVSTEITGDQGDITPVMDWSEEQKSIAKVPYHMIPDDMLADIRQDIRRSGQEESTELFEMLAGQIALVYADPREYGSFETRYNKILYPQGIPQGNPGSAR